MIKKEPSILLSKPRKNIIKSWVNSYNLSQTQKLENKLKNELELDKKVVIMFEDLDHSALEKIVELLHSLKFNVRKLNLKNEERFINKLIFAFIRDSLDLSNESDFYNKMYNTNYYLNKYRSFCIELDKRIKKSETKFQNDKEKKKIITNCNKNIEWLFSDIIFYDYSTLLMHKSKNGLQYDKLNPLFKNVKDKNSFEYYSIIAELFILATFISRVLFLNKLANQVDNKSEMYMILSNMIFELNTISVVCEKFQPIYNEFYIDQFYSISDGSLYNISITFLINRIRKTALTETDNQILNILDNQSFNPDDYFTYFENWIEEIAKIYKEIDIKNYILLKISSLIELLNYNQLIQILGDVNKLKDIYSSKSKLFKNQNARERYLRGDLSKEKSEISGKYNLENISTGYQFEKYLDELFHSFGYETVHNGRTGDQGADLLLKNNDFVYAVQAKFYSGSLGNTPVQEISASLKFYNANQGVVVTNSYFTKGAIKLAKANNVILIDGIILKELVRLAFQGKANKDILQEYS